MAETDLFFPYMKPGFREKLPKDLFHFAYGIEGVCLGLPAVVGRSGVSQVLDLPLSRDETERLLASAHKLKTLMEG